MFVEAGMQGLEPAEVRSVADEVLSLWRTGKSTRPFSDRYKGFTSDDAYAVAALTSAAREAHGDRIVGRKVGFTNKAAWKALGISAPMWGYMFRTTVFNLADIDNRFALDGFAEPRIEPEIVVGLKGAPAPDMSEGELRSCIDWVAHGFEIAQCVYPGWRFAVADAIANQCLHAALLIGRRSEPNDEVWGSMRTLSLDLCRDGKVVQQGRAETVLGGPMESLRSLIELLASDEGFPPLRAGEVVTTGTLSAAPDIASGQTWSTVLHDTPIAGIEVRLE
jgi:2-oxo-3-hexenedioate decarboxylase